MNARDRDRYIQNLQDDEDENIIPDGGKVTISMALMDSTQSAIAGQSAIDERARQSAIDNQFVLDTARRNHDRAMGYAAGFTHQREQRGAALRGSDAYTQYCQRVSSGQYLEVSA